MISSFFTSNYIDYSSKGPFVEELLTKTQHSCLVTKNTMKQLFQFSNNFSLLKKANHFNVREMFVLIFCGQTFFYSNNLLCSSYTQLGIPAYVAAGAVYVAAYP